MPWAAGSGWLGEQAEDRDGDEESGHDHATDQEPGEGVGRGGVGGRLDIAVKLVAFHEVLHSSRLHQRSTTMPPINAVATAARQISVALIVAILPDSAGACGSVYDTAP